MAVAKQIESEGYGLVSPVIPKVSIIEKDGLFIEEGNVLLGDSLKVGDVVDVSHWNRPRVRSHYRKG